MAAVEVSASGAVVKLRRPWTVGALSLVPFYWFVWYYRVNREMRDYGRARGDARLGESRPGRSVLAVTLGSLVIVPQVLSLWHAMRRIEACERIAGSASEGVAPALSLVIAACLLPLVGTAMGAGAAALAVTFAGCAALIAVTVLMQRRLSRLWHAGG
jgi:hypothetical protein